MPVISAVGMVSRKRGARGSPELKRWTQRSSRDRSASRCALHLAGVETASAHFHLDDLAFGPDDACHLKVRLPRSTRLVVRVGHVVAEGHSLAAHVAAAAIDLRHDSVLHQLDARHLSAVTLAVAGLED